MLLPSDFLHSCSAQLTKAYQTATVLFEVLKAVTQQHSVEVDHEVYPTKLFASLCCCCALIIIHIDITPITNGSGYRLDFVCP